MDKLHDTMMEALRLADIALSKDLSKRDRNDVIGIVREAMQAYRAGKDS